MYRVLGCLTDQHDYRLVLLAAAVCAATAVTAFGIYSRVGHARASMRWKWVVLTGVCAASGIWATHFVAMLAYKSGVPTAYDPTLTAASLLIAMLATTLGFAECAGGSRRQVIIGGAIIGLGISLMHFTGMKALLTEGHIEWDLAIAGTAVVFGMLIATAAALAFHALKGKTAIAAGAALLTVAICAMHFTAMGAAVIVPDPTIDISHGFSANASMMALAIAGLTVLVILAGLSAALIDHQTMVDNMGQIRELVDAASEGIVIAADGVVVNVNRRITELCGRPLEELVGANVSGDLLHDFDLEPSAVESPTKEARLQAADGRSIPVEVIRRQFRTGVPGNEVYAIRDLTERHRNEARIAHMARHDALTDLPNRILLRERLDPALSGRREEKIALLCLDLDRFKAVNDTLGHPVGDALLKQVAKRLLGCVRARDTVARIGGDEFVILHDTKDPSKEAAALASRIIEVISAPYDVNGHQVTIGTSVGIAVPLDDDVTPESLLAQADMALYSSKGSGRGTYSFFEQEMNTRAHERRELERDLRLALANGELELNYQPLMNLENNEIRTVEALLRWRHPRRGMIPPVEFIPIAEETGLIVAIGDWVLRQATAEAMRWPEHIKVAVNLSSVQFKKRNLSDSVMRALRDTGLAPHRLELEITESVLLQDSEGTLETLRRLRNMGIAVSMDDFGTGYSSLSYLQKFPFDKIKIDRCFLANISSSEESLAVIRAISGIGRALGLVATAEGVETREQLDLIRAEGCTEMQGYFLSPPVTADDLRNRILANPVNAAPPESIKAA